MFQGSYKEALYYVTRSFILCYTKALYYVTRKQGKKALYYVTRKLYIMLQGSLYYVSRQLHFMLQGSFILCYNKALYYVTRKLYIMLHERFILSIIPYDYSVSYPIEILKLNVYIHQKSVLWIRNKTKMLVPTCCCRKWVVNKQASSAALFGTWPIIFAFCCCRCYSLCCAY